MDQNSVVNINFNLKKKDEQLFLPTEVDVSLNNRTTDIIDMKVKQTYCFLSVHSSTFVDHFLHYFNEKQQSVISLENCLSCKMMDDNILLLSCPPLNQITMNQKDVMKLFQTQLYDFDLVKTNNLFIHSLALQLSRVIFLVMDCNEHGLMSIYEREYLESIKNCLNQDIIGSFKNLSDRNDKFIVVIHYLPNFIKNDNELFSFLSKQNEIKLLGNLEKLTNNNIYRIVYNNNQFQFSKMVHYFLFNENNKDENSDWKFKYNKETIYYLKTFEVNSILSQKEKAFKEIISFSLNRFMKSISLSHQLIDSFKWTKKSEDGYKIHLLRNEEVKEIEINHPKSINLLYPVLSENISLREVNDGQEDNNSKCYYLPLDGKEINDIKLNENSGKIKFTMNYSEKVINWMNQKNYLQNSFDLNNNNLETVLQLPYSFNMDKFQEHGYINFSFYPKEEYY